MFWKKDEKLKQDLEETKERLRTLEKDYHSLALTMQNLQSAILAMSRNQDVVASEVRSVQEMVAHFLHEIDPAQIMFGYSDSRDDN